jgi:protein tyrosine/serine phosphatase
LWLGDKYIAHNLEFITQNEIKYIINITDNINNKFDFVSYVNFRIRDIMACETDTLDVLKQGAEIINVVLHHNLPILIHCKQGHHRSASIVAFYLMQYHHLSLLSALHLIKQIRPRAFRRVSCMLKTLIDYEVDRMKN